MTQDAAERFVADDLFVLGQRLIFIGPLTSEWPILHCLMGTRLVVKLSATRNEMIEVLSAEDNEEFQAFVLKRFPPSFDKGILIWGSRSRGLDSAIDSLKDLVEFFDMLAVTVADDVG